MTLSAPFPWFGGKSQVAGDVWAALGNVDHYVEPFFGSGAVLLARPHRGKVETINDADAMLCNFWRAVQADPDAVASHADWPVNETDLHARHAWLVGERAALADLLHGDSQAFDARIAGWWVWGSCNWIGGGFCSGAGPWQIVDGRLVDSRKLPHVSDAGQGIKRQLPHLFAGRGINRQLPHLGNAGQGINRKLPHLGDAGRGKFIREWFGDLADRLREVRVACGDWSRITGPSVLRAGGGLCGVFLDPPYDVADRADVYATESKVAPDVRAWCAANGANPALRIVLAGYAGEHDELQTQGWRVVEWKARGGYGSQGDGDGRANAKRERLWLSPHCNDVKADLFAELSA